MGYPLKEVGGGQEGTPRVGEVVEVLAERHAGKSGLVTGIHAQGKVQVELADGGGLLQAFRYRLAREDVLGGGPRSHVRRARAKPRPRETTIEVRAVCRHVRLADLCRECVRGSS